MASRPRQRAWRKDAEISLEARLEDLELRIQLLEARLREVSALPRLMPKAPKKPSKTRDRRSGGERCPGCLLEQPPGRTRDSCVWCGFCFDAVRKRAFR